jgi:hypothetical protein
MGALIVFEGTAGSALHNGVMALTVRFIGQSLTRDRPEAIFSRLGQNQFPLKFVRQ